MLVAAGVCFAMALLAWPLHRLLGRWTGPLLAVGPAWLFAELLGRLPAVRDALVPGAATTALPTTPPHPLGIPVTDPVAAPSAPAPSLFESFPWLPQFDVSLAFRLDGLSLMFALLILGVGALVFAYAGAYMHKHGGGGRFYPTLAAFMGSMLGLVLSDNLIALFVFWELTSVTSFLLIGFDHHKEKARKAALQALLVTGMGGLALLGGLLLLGHAAGTMSLSQILASNTDLSSHVLYPGIVWLVAIGAFTKSAQVPFHFWLPNAMVAPTPVSTYLHSATMVKAGVFLLARLQPVLGDGALWTGLLTAAGLATVLTGAVMAVVQTDLKRLLAYATVAALGTMVLLIGLGSDYALAALPVYLLAHGMYKAALFLIAGLIDMKTGTRDIRLLGGLWRKMPVTAVFALLAGLSFAGLPPAAGYLGKELMYKAGADPHLGGWAFVVALGLLVAKVLLFGVAFLVALKPFIGAQTKHAVYAKDGGPFVMAGPVLLGGLGIYLGLYGMQAFYPLTSAAAQAVAGHVVKLDLTLWHGFVPAFWLSVATVAFGGVLLLYLAVLRGWGSLAAPLAWYGPSQHYEHALRGMFAVGHWQTALLQDGRLRHYIAIVLVTVLLLAGGTFVLRGGMGEVNPSVAGVRLYEVLLAALALAGAVGTVFSRSRLMAVATLGVTGFSVALNFLVFSGPDLSATQFAVETLGVILFVFVLYKLPRFRSLSGAWTRVRDAVVAVATGLFFTLLVLAAYDPEQPLSGLGRWFAENSYVAGKGKNVVNVILVDFRALDTLGEITVIAIAAIGVYGLLKVRGLTRRTDVPGHGIHNQPDGTVCEDLEAQR